MSFAEHTPDDEVSHRTALAMDAQMEAFKAQSGVAILRRQFARVNWVWGVLAFLGVVGGIGYALRDRLEAFATKDKVEANTADIERLRSEQKEMNAVLRGLIDTQKRTLDGVDDVKRILMNEKRR